MEILPLAIGTTVAVGTAFLARVTKFDHDRSFFAAILIVIAAYYVLFACIASDSIIVEILIATIFSAFAIMGALRWPIVLGIGIAAHGIFDMFHGLIIHNVGVPTWWPAFCASVDVLLGLWVIYLVKTGADLAKFKKET